MTTDLSKYSSAYGGPYTFEGWDKIRLHDFEVCELVQDYLVAAISWIESRDLLVHKVTISPEAIRAYPPPPAEGNGYIGPEFIEIPLPRGLYARAVDLSCGPLTPFPAPSPPEAVKLLLGRLQQVAFPDLVAPISGWRVPKHIVLNVNEFYDVLKWLSARLDRSTSRDELQTGLQGTLWEHEASRNVDSQTPAGRSVKVWIHRGVTPGTVLVSVYVPPPAWDFNRTPGFSLTGEPQGKPQGKPQVPIVTPNARTLPETTVVEWDASEGIPPGGLAKVTLQTPGGELLRVSVDLPNFAVLKRAVGRCSRSF